MNDAKHSSLPWTWSGSMPGCTYTETAPEPLSIHQECGDTIAYPDDGIHDKETAEANADFIVTACNAHYDLLAACERFTIAMRANDKPCLLSLLSVLADVDAAIAKAKGGEA